VLATQTLPQRRPKTMAVNVDHWDRRRHGSRHRVPRPGCSRAQHGGPDDGVQHVHRSRRPGRNGGPG
jgi:hypothetical protein